MTLTTLILAWVGAVAAVVAAVTAIVIAVIGSSKQRGTDAALAKALKERADRASEDGDDLSFKVQTLMGDVRMNTRDIAAANEAREKSEARFDAKLDSIHEVVTGLRITLGD